MTDQTACPRCIHDERTRGVLQLSAMELYPPDHVSGCRAALRDRIAEALEQADYRPDMRRGDLADAIMPVLPAPTDRAEWDALASETDRLRKAWAEMRDRAEHIEAEVERLRTGRAAVLTAAERTMLTYALDQAQEHIWARDGFTDEDQAAVDSLRRLTLECPQCGDTGACNGGPCPLRRLAAEAQPAPHSCGNCDGVDPATCLTNPDRKPPAAGAQQDGARS